MIQFLKQCKRLLAWFMAGLVFVVLCSLGITSQQPVIALTQNNTQVQTQSIAIDAYAGENFASTHLEPNFYQ